MKAHSFPYPGTGNRRLPAPRRPKKNSERRQWNHLYGRKKRSPSRLWDDRYDEPFWFRKRSWKHYRNTQYRAVKK